MATSIEDMFDEVDGLLRIGKQQAPFDQLMAMLDELGEEEIRDWKHDFNKAIERLMPKRRSVALKRLENRLSSHIDSAQEIEHSDDSLDDNREIESYINALTRNMEYLASSHIFQWGTFYRDAVSRYFENAISLRLTTYPESLKRISQIFAAHAEHIFSTGYRHHEALSRLDHRTRINKSLNGLESFLALGVENFVSAVNVHDRIETKARRLILSAFLAAVLTGYANCRLGTDHGKAVLPRFPRSWANSIGFLTGDDCSTVISHLEPGAFQENLSEIALPTLAAIDAQCESEADYYPTPVLSEFNWSARRLDVSLEEPPDASEPRRITISCFLNDAFFSLADIEEANRQGIAIVIARLRPDIARELSTRHDFSTIVIDFARSSAIKHSLNDVVFQRRSRRGLDAPLTYNFAKEFPLRHPSRKTYFHVPRTSVRDLLRTFERKNGIRLWCSVRRSGKTTACFDLSGSESQSCVVSQTCDSTEEHVGANMFYEAVVEVLEAGNQIRRDFVYDLVKRCAHRESERYILVVDEYETLFQRLVVAVRRNPEVRLMVAQPILNQLVGFAQGNLLVFLGQQPNAHFILMDQNQLSAYVQQDAFPLFVHSPGTTIGELSDLVVKVFQKRIAFDASFLDALYSETSGHPYLTVNVLVEFVDYLIDRRAPRKNLRVDGDDFIAFARSRLTASAIQMSGEYEFFRAAAAEALSEEGRVGNPWLFSVYSLLRAMARQSLHGDYTLTDIEIIYRRLGIDRLGIPLESVVRTASQSNFLAREGQVVSVKVKTLGRIADAVIPGAGVL